jgi:hypothetical protein
MRKLGLILVSVLLGLLLAAPQSASAGAFVLHPSGFGEHSYSSWKGGEGLPDNTGKQDQALYFQKMTDTTTFAAGVAIFKGFEGMPTSAISSLEFWWGTDGHCGAGAPRFNVRFVDLTGNPVTLFFGCNSGMTPTDPTSTQVAPNGRIFERRCAGVCDVPLALPPGTIRSVAIVFDEGTTAGGVPTGFAGFVFLDNIVVGDHTWKSASDNGNNPDSSANTAETLTLEELEALLGEPISTLFPQT